VATPVSIVIPAFNQLHYCQLCVNSIQVHTDRPYRLILVDNGSTDGVAEFFDSVPGARVVHLPENRGFAAGVNAGLAHAEGHVVLLNSDTIVTPAWLDRLERPLHEAGDVGMVGPVSNCVSGAQQIPTPPLDSPDSIAAFAMQWASAHAGETEPAARLVGFCVLIRDRVLETLGPLDERFGIGNYEDDDYCIRVSRAGYRLVVARDCFIFHFGSRTFAGMGFDTAQWNALMERNRTAFLRKWTVEAEGHADGADRAEALRRTAHAAHAEGRWTDAIRILKEAIEAFPLDATVYNDLGAVLWDAGEGQRALGYFERALRINPHHQDARANLTAAQRALGIENTAGGQAGG